MTYASIVKSLSKMVDQLVKHESNQRDGILINEARIADLNDDSDAKGVEADKARATATKLREIIS